MNNYLVMMKLEGEAHEGKIMSPMKVFNMMDMSDCYDIDIDLYKVGKYGDALIHCTFHDTWSDPSDPLKMWISGDDGVIYDVGYGSDH